MRKIILPGFLIKLGKGFPLAVLLALIVVGMALALTLAGADGIWSNSTGSSGSPTCLTYLNTASTTDENQVRYGNNNQWGGCPTNTNLQSGFGYDGAEGVDVTPGNVFLLGEFTHYNRPIYANSVLQTVDLNIALNFIEPTISSSLEYTVQLDETPNEQGTCAYPGTTICPDKVDLSDTIPDQTFGPIGGKYYKLQIVGFAPGTEDTCRYVAGQTINEFITEEGQENNACLFARMLVEEPAIQIIKTPDIQYITSAGGDVTFDIAVSNVGNVDLEAVAVADALTADCVRTGTWDGDTLAIGETATYSCTLEDVTAAFTNVAVVTGQKVGDPTKTVTDEDDAVVAIQDSQITIIKDVVIESETEEGNLEDWWHQRDFSFTTSSTGSDIIDSYDLDDDCDPLLTGCPASVEGQDGVLNEKITFSGITAGVYTFYETQPTGTTWILAPQGGEIDGIACTAVDMIAGASVIPTVSITNNSTNGNVAITLAANQNVTCTFTNKPGPGGTAVTLSHIKARAKTDFALAGSVLVFGALLLGTVITRKRRSF